MNARSMNEPIITINGKVLTTAQALTIRVAVSSFLMDMREEGLGDDDHGKKMAGLYIERASELELMMTK